MPFPTIVGASNQSLSVNLDGHHAQALGSNYQDAIVNLQVGPGIASTIGGAPAWGGQAASSLINMRAVPLDGSFKVKMHDSRLLAGGLHPASVAGGIGDTISAGGAHITQGAAHRPDLSFIGGAGTAAGQATLFGAHGDVGRYLAQKAAAARGHAVSHHDSVHGAQSAHSLLPQAASSHVVLNGWSDHKQSGALADSTRGALSHDKSTVAGSTVPGAQAHDKAKDLVHFLDSSKAQHTVMTDFGSAAGNMVGMNQHEQSGSHNAMSVGGSKGGVFSDQHHTQKAQITFLDDQHAHKNSMLFKHH